jgi:hypothetical protein
MKAASVFDANLELKKPWIKQSFRGAGTHHRFQ